MRKSEKCSFHDSQVGHVSRQVFHVLPSCATLPFRLAKRKARAPTEDALASLATDFKEIRLLLKDFADLRIEARVLVHLLRTLLVESFLALLELGR